VLGVGMTFVIITSGIDLSVGSVLVFASVVSAKVMEGMGGTGPGVAAAGIVVAIVGGMAWGIVNGVLVEQDTQIRSGDTIDVRNGRILLTTTSGAASFFSGRFLVEQTGNAPPLFIQNPQRLHVPPPVNLFDIEITWQLFRNAHSIPARVERPRAEP